MIIPCKHHNNQEDTSYKIDIDNVSSVGAIYRVWKENLLLGTFYQRSKKWVANPYYFNYMRLPFSQGLEDMVRSNHLAIKHIIDVYEGN